MKGKFPDILNNPASGEAARKLWDDAQVMLDRIIDEKWLTAAGVFGLFPANAVDDDDIEVYTDETRTEVLTDAAPGAPADRAPRGRAAPLAGRLRRARRRPALRDYVGGVRGDRRARQRRAKIARVQGGARRLQRDPARVAGRPAGRGVRRAAARAGAHRVLGLPARRGPRQRVADQGELRRHPPGARATRPAPSTPRSRRSGSCSTSRPTPASS